MLNSEFDYQPKHGGAKLQENLNQEPYDDNVVVSDKVESIGCIDMGLLSSDYLLFGGNGAAGESPELALFEALDYLDEQGFGDNALSKTRRGSFSDTGVRDFFGAIERYCDFCGRPLTGVAYERLNDGRDRCSQCSETVVVGQRAYERLFHQVKTDMQVQFGVSFPDQIIVRIVSPERIAKYEKREWKPTDAFDPRTISLVKQSRWKKKISILLESGIPRMSLMETMAQCLTRAWQLDAWDEVALRKRYGSEYDEVEKGMHIWVGIQYLYLLNEAAYAKRMREYYVELDEPMGKGYVRYANCYPFSEGIVLEGDTPFRHPSDPLGFSAG